MGTAAVEIKRDRTFTSNHYRRIINAHALIQLIDTNVCGPINTSATNTH